MVAVENGNQKKKGCATEMFKSFAKAKRHRDFEAARQALHSTSEMQAVCQLESMLANVRGMSNGLDGMPKECLHAIKVNVECALTHAHEARRKTPEWQAFVRARTAIEQDIE